MEKYLKEVEDRLRELASRSGPTRWLAEHYIGGGQSKLTYLNLKIPSVRAEFKRGFSFSDKSPKDQWKIWDYIWRNSNIFEVMLMPSYWINTRPFDEVFSHRKQILNWQSRVDNWGHSDEMSAHYARFLEHDPARLLPTFKKWNQSKKPWLKRQSLVGLMFYSRFRKTHPPLKLILGFIDRHLLDEHYYVQKAVGWTLREAWNVYPREMYAYLKKNAHAIAPGAWTAATEKLSAKDKAVLTNIRRDRKT